MSVVEQSPFRAAFLNMKVTPEVAKSHKQIIRAASDLLIRHAGTRRIPDWNAHLKLKTYKALVADKIMPVKETEQKVAS